MSANSFRMRADIIASPCTLSSSKVNRLPLRWDKNGNFYFISSLWRSLSVRERWEVKNNCSVLDTITVRKAKKWFPDELSCTYSSRIDIFSMFDGFISLPPSFLSVLERFRGSKNTQKITKITRKNTFFFGLRPRLSITRGNYC